MFSLNSFKQFSPTFADVQRKHNFGVWNLFFALTESFVQGIALAVRVPTSCIRVVMMAGKTRKARFTASVAILCFLAWTQAQPVVQVISTWDIIARTRHASGKLHELGNCVDLKGTQKSQPEYCRIGTNNLELDRLVELKKEVVVQDRVWQLGPFSFTWNPIGPDVSQRKESHVILVIVESLRLRDIPAKFPTMRSVLHKHKQRASFDMCAFSVNRVGLNSVPNRRAVLLGNSLPASQSVEHERSSLFRAAAANGYKVMISETVERPCQHASNTLSLLVGNCADFEKPYRDVFQQANCIRPLQYGQEKKCRSFPIPSVHLPTNCSGNSVHHLMVAQVLDAIKGSEKTFSMMNFYDFHIPNLYHASPDFDQAMSNLIDSLMESEKPFKMLILGDHGHGLLSESGDAGAILLSNSDTATETMNLSPTPSQITMNRVLLALLGDHCASQGIPVEYCTRCSLGTTQVREWNVSFEFNRTRGRFVNHWNLRNTEATIIHDDATITATILRTLVCKRPQSLHSESTTSGLQIKFSVKRERCTFSYVYDYGGPQIASMPSVEYAGFKRFALYRMLTYMLLLALGHT